MSERTKGHGLQNTYKKYVVPESKGQPARTASTAILKLVCPRTVSQEDGHDRGVNVGAARGVHDPSRPVPGDPEHDYVEADLTCPYSQRY